MNEEIFLQYLEKRKADCLEQAKALESEERRDESSFYKAKGNIYEIYATLFTAAKKRTADLVQMKEAYLSQTTKISQQWRDSLARAQAHDDAKKVLLEESKLAAADEIIEKFQEMWEG